MKKAFYLILCTFVLCVTLTSCGDNTLPKKDETAAQTSSHETEAVETAAPETAAPETDAPETAAPETDAPETVAPETNPIETAAQILRPEGFDLSNAFRTDTFKARNSVKIPYSLYLPEGYSETEKYPLLVYLHAYTSESTEQEFLMREAGILFDHPSSPAFQSIVLIAQCSVNTHNKLVASIWENNTLDALNELTDHINATYSTDLNRQYYVGLEDGADGVWQMMERFPERISAAVPVNGNRIYILKYSDGTYVPVGITEKMAEIPLYMVYDKSAYRIGYDYVKTIRDELLKKGAEQVLVKEIAGSAFTSEKDISVLSWLFRQSRLTGEKEDSGKDDSSKKDAVNTFFNAGDWFDYGEFTASNGITLPYRYYLPEGYDESEEYPLLLFLHHNGAQGTDNEGHIFTVNSYFSNEDSPVYDSIVILPQCPPNMWWRGKTIDALAELLVFVNTQFSADSARQYVSGGSMGGDGAWNLAEEYPHLISASVPVVGGGLNFNLDSSDHTYVVSEFNPELLKVPIYYVYDTEDHTTCEVFQRSTVRVMQDYGAENFIYKETNTYGHGAGNVCITVDDISVLEWLYAQRKETTGSVEAD